ncbi:ABC transporter ATP-binding protein [[Clostridium] fimetarium]|uniref:ABC-2 type transport system ATP-binding protein n=1 Tax=[Clostridium] fimetarium TaxID=99656 RepID=A0A1I0R2V3_9FIRM|nr:ABC transporter ATP-binding protein [[Clostridium] fimetarium]SEW34674.1 ABC-2 type transport system ATP-binding protein [[Clostridium] fimetarium]
MEILKVENLCKSFGTHKVIDGLSFSVDEHTIYGFLGQNGSGKTTTMKMILGLLKLDSGTITICGEKVTYGETKTNKYIGFLPDVPEFYGYMRPMEYLKLCGEITGLSKQAIKEKSEELLTLVGLIDVKRKIGGFSRGMKQRLGIAQALLNEPRILICDEPTSALDPVGRKDILDILLSIKDKTTVIFSTHILSDVERVCENIGMINDGKLAISGNINALKEVNRHDIIYIEFESENDRKLAYSSLEKMEDIKEIIVEKNSLTIKVHDVKKTGNSIIHKLAGEQLYILKYEILEPTLESIFMEVVK